MLVATELATKKHARIAKTIINDAYRVGESGILLDTKEDPLQRVTSDDVMNMIESQQLLVLKIKEDGDQDEVIVGCVKAEMVKQQKDGTEKNIVEWGCLAVAESYQGKGYGNRLVLAVEDYIRTTLKCKTAQLELLAPSSWKHAHKERLRDWYKRLGYTLKVPDDYKASTMSLPTGSVLADRFFLITDADFTCYQKQLSQII